jgi:hypothetical protein
MEPEPSSANVARTSRTGGSFGAAGGCAAAAMLPNASVRTAAASPPDLDFPVPMAEGPLSTQNLKLAKGLPYR